MQLVLKLFYSSFLILLEKFYGHKIFVESDADVFCIWFLLLKGTGQWMNEGFEEKTQNYYIYLLGVLYGKVKYLIQICCSHVMGDFLQSPPLTGAWELHHVSTIIVYYNE